MERRIVRIWRAGDQLPVAVSTCLQYKFKCQPTLQDIEANATKPVDVRVVDFGEEADLWRSHRIVIGEEKLELEDAACPLSVRLHPLGLSSVRHTFIWRL